MSYSFNLIDRPWIPCVEMDGGVTERSLRDTLAQAHTLRGVVGDSPLETASLYRLLLAVLHSALRGPRSVDAWEELWRKGRWDMSQFDPYLEKWHHRFDLFDPQRPFFQWKDERVKPKSTISLVFDMVNGNMATLFDHHTESTGVMLTPSKAARTVVAAQTFGLAGLCFPGVSFTDSPWSRGVIFLLEGDNLFETLMFNLLRYPNEGYFPMVNNDLPAWEMDNPFHPDREIPFGYLDYLTWQNRKVFLFVEDYGTHIGVRNMTVAPALRLSSSVIDPNKHYRIDEKKGKLFMRFNEDRVLWRDSSALLRTHDPNKAEPPKVFHWLSLLAYQDIIEYHHTYRFMALGMANDQAKVEFFREEHLPLPIEYLKSDELVEKLDTALRKAEETRKELWSSGSLLALLIISPNSDGKPWKDINKLIKEQSTKLYNYWGIERIYWSKLEIPFLDILQSLPQDDSALSRWKRILKEAAWEGLENAERLAGESTSALKAAVIARNTLAAGLNKIFSENKT